jgi:uncharacterized Zn-binding protein involved in type VI secretion
MRRNVLLQGDKSSVGGVVTQGIQGTFNNGVPLAFLGAKVSCPACNTTGYIVPTGPRLAGDLMGKRVALEGDLCACRCSPQPTMCASSSGISQTIDTGALTEPDGTAIADPANPEA